MRKTLCLTYVIVVRVKLVAPTPLEGGGTNYSNGVFCS